MASTKLRIYLKAYDSRLLDQSAKKIAETAKKAGAVFAYGAFLTDFLQFLILAFVVFCLIRQLNKLIPIPKEPPKTKICPFCKSEIPHEATKCAHCTSDLPTT